MNFIFFYFEFAALVFGLIKYKQLERSKYLKLVWLIGLIVIAEAIGMYLRRILHVPNVKVYNISTSIEFLVYGKIFSEINNREVYKKYFKGFLLGYPLLWIINEVFIQGFETFHTYTMLIGSIAMIIMSCNYFLDSIKSNKRINLIDSPDFWFSTGVLIFYSSDMFNTYLLANTHKMVIFENFSMLKMINTILNMILYSCFIKVFYLSAKSNKSKREFY